MVHHSMLAGPLVHRWAEIPVCQSVPDSLFMHKVIPSVTSPLVTKTDKHSKEEITL